MYKAKGIIANLGGIIDVSSIVIKDLAYEANAKAKDMKIFQGHIIISRPTETYNYELKFTFQ